MPGLTERSECDRLTVMSENRKQLIESALAELEKEDAGQVETATFETRTAKSLACAFPNVFPMPILYHGTSAPLFGRFSLDHALEGDGKCKFGWGVYGTESRAHALAKNGGSRNTPPRMAGHSTAGHGTPPPQMARHGTEGHEAPLPNGKLRLPCENGFGRLPVQRGTPRWTERKKNGIYKRRSSTA